jgi:hypothetical protein
MEETEKIIIEEPKPGYDIDRADEIGYKIENILFDANIEGFVYIKKVGCHIEIGEVDITLLE